ncbi:hypothetical protein BN1723_009989 [Verticillium longisporum]|uniref:Zn(2)-C6 fungal-type domain-containing protein n=1 Tax=Verticillium longisporum TaxID=100787 RepID=A0A0G4KUC6_VERLO|nr:Sterol uptake control protein 2 like [Verticillium longisporum]KAG7144777.1 Sterol uptake control protein 2 like [Verticillium longisporum]CRK13347.1 hypothetical protein BN1723_009989 [Verticillium longisporum]
MATDDAPSRSRHKRTRTGCMKCRTRRRKCDEEKPKCRRCIEGGFDCQYGPRLTFLHKNALTVSPTPKSNETQYSRLQFVDPGSSVSTSKESDGGDGNNDMTTSPTPSGATLERLIESTPMNPEVHELVAAETPREQAPFVNDQSTPGPWPQDGDPIQSSPQHSMVVMTDRMQASPKDADYQTALTVLLSLGNDEPPQIIHSPSHERVTALHPPLVSSPSSAGASVIGTISQETILQLLRQYRYQVAPWLDICDMSQCFGLVVPRLAMESGSALHSLLALSSQSLQAERLTQTNDHSLHIIPDTSFMQNQVFESVNDSELIHLALASTTQFLRDVPGSWHSTTCLLADGAHLEELGHPPSKLRLSVLGLLLRLDLGKALINGTTVSIPEQLNYPATPTEWQTSAIADTVFHSASESLLLCAQAVNFGACSFPAPASTTGSAPRSPVQRWTMLNDALSTWYTNRPQEFHPMIEMEVDDSLFPVLLFTNGAAVFANQLYHTAMLLMLQNRPRTLSVGAARKDPTMSPLWHAQRVCGIAMNNDRRDSWDLCLVAALYRAAQRMTYEPQQLAVLSCFEKIKTMTGWHVSFFVDKAREDWGMATG